MARTQTVGQVLAQEKTARQRANTVGATVKKNLAKETLFSGLIQVYHPDGDENDPAVYTEPEESNPVQLRVEPDLFDALREALAPSLNLTAAKEHGNQSANADLVLDDQTTLEGLPATYLLFLEHQLAELESVLKAVPVLNSSETWIPSATRGIWQTEKPERRNREEKTEVPSVGHQGNEHHAPQVKWLPKAVKTGVREKTRFSGAIEPQRKEELLLRLHQVKQAIHRAREQANQSEAPARDTGSRLLDYLFA